MSWILALCLAVAPEQAPTPVTADALLGQWESVVRTDEGVGNVLEFFPDGRVSQISTSMGEADYRVVDDRLVTTWKDPATGRISEVETRIEFEGNQKFLEKGGDEASGGDNWSDRIGDAPPKGSPLSGQWCSLFLESLPAYREFKDGRMYNRLPVVVLRGHYAASGDVLTVTMQDQPPGQYPFRIENGILSIRSRNGAEKQYRRPETSLLRGY
jgi:hypothetical protein